VLRRVLNKVQRDAGDRRATPYPADELARSALVVSPHQDDETLGCGGAIAAKRRAGADVAIVFLMDGTTSHRPLIDGARLGEIRRAEAVAAAQRLGVPEAQVTFLDLPEGRLADHRDAAVAGLHRLLARTTPDEVFAPSGLEPQRDHHEANAVTRLALHQHAQPLVLSEYAVWSWYYWPKVPLPFSRWSAPPPLKRLPEARRILKTTRAVTFGARVYSEFSTCLDVSAVLDDKRAALAEYKSQTTRYLPDPRWATLGDVGGGAFLDALLTPTERFHRARWSPGGTAGP
jgi:LmbE family N-acetylglucosaminyl deacetylase